MPQVRNISMGWLYYPFTGMFESMQMAFEETQQMAFEKILQMAFEEPTTKKANGFYFIISCVHRCLTKECTLYSRTFVFPF